MRNATFDLLTQHVLKNPVHLLLSVGLGLVASPLEAKHSGLLRQTPSAFVPSILNPVHLLSLLP